MDTARLFDVDLVIAPESGMQLFGRFGEESIGIKVSARQSDGFDCGFYLSWLQSQWHLVVPYLLSPIDHCPLVQTKTRKSCMTLLCGLKDLQRVLHPLPFSFRDLRVNPMADRSQTIITISGEPFTAHNFVTPSGMPRAELSGTQAVVLEEKVIYWMSLATLTTCQAGTDPWLNPLPMLSFQREPVG